MNQHQPFLYLCPRHSCMFGFISHIFKKFIFHLLQKVNLCIEDYSYFLPKIFLFSPILCFLKEDTIKCFCSSKKSLADPWHCYRCSCTFLYIIDDLGPSRQRQYTSRIDYHTVRGFWSLNFPFLNRINSLLNNKNSRRSKFTIVINILQRTKHLSAVEDLDSLKILTLLPYPLLHLCLNLASLVMFGFADI